MSSNAFARSRPRVRHQRVPRGNSSCDHPRFLQLVNELARINDAKKKQEEADGVGIGIGSTSCTADCNSEDQESALCSNVVQNSSGNSCCDTAEAQSSNGYRSLDSNQAASTLHDEYHHQQQQHQQQQHQHLHNHSQHQPQQHSQHNQNHLQLQQQQQQHFELQQHIGNTLHQDRCQSNDHISKSSSTGFGYLKQNLVDEQQHSSDFSNNSLDLRQDENRTKRKRSANEASASSKRNSSMSCGSSGASKRHKSASDAIRPLSPSFTKCPICLLDSMDRDPSFTNTCFHLFCFVCIENWTKNKATCPLCRTKFTKIIFNIKSATVYDEKTASPIRRDDDDGYIADRLMLEHLSGLNPSSTVSARSANSDDVQFLFENLRNPEVLMPQYFVNQMDPRQGESLHSFNAVTATPNFNSNVPHPPFTTTSYPITPNYIALFPQNRITPTTNTAITSAYTANTSLTNINNDPSSRRISRSGRYIYTRNYEPPAVDRISRSSNASINQSVPLERHHHHQQQHQPQHQHQHQHQNHHPHHHHQHQHAQHRSTLDMSPRHSQRIDQSHAHIPLPYPIQPRHFYPNAHPRRPFNSPQVDHQQILDTLYRQMPDM